MKVEKLLSVAPENLNRRKQGKLIYNKHTYIHYFSRNCKFSKIIQEKATYPFSPIFFFVSNWSNAT